MQDPVVLQHTPRSKVPTIYGLFDPADRLFRYVGQSIDADARFADHVSGRSFSANPSMAYWVADLREQGRAPRLEILEVCHSWRDLDNAEREWIRKLKEAGHPLLNMTAGGAKVRRATPAGLARKDDWIELGFVMKCAEDALMDARVRLGRMTGDSSPESASIDVALKKISNVKNTLDNRLHKEFPAWTEFVKVFYGASEEHFRHLKLGGANTDGTVIAPPSGPT